MTIEERRAQVAAQYKAVAHMAKALAEVHEQLASTFETGGADSILDMCGARSHRFMETLGDILNGIDAVTEDDDWTAPVFEKAAVMLPIDAALSPGGVT